MYYRGNKSVKKPGIALILLACGLSLYGQAIALSEAGQGSSEEPSLTTKIGNVFLPGLIQVQQGDSSGYWYMSSVPLLAVGIYFYCDYMRNDSVAGKNWEYGLGDVLVDAGTSLYAYSSYAYERDAGGRSGAWKQLRVRESYTEILTAPLLPENFLDPAIILPLGLCLASSLAISNFDAIGDFFARSSVTFMGQPVSPTLGTALDLSFNMAFNLFVAAAEEIIFRGILLDRGSPTVSALAFGAVHMSNLAVRGYYGNGDELESAIRQSVNACIFGFYANYLDANDSYRLRKSATMHYWNNVLAMSLDYIQGNGMLEGN